MKKYTVLYLSEKDVQKCITMKEIVEAVELGMKLLGEGKAIQPPKIYQEIPQYGGFIKPMIAFVDKPLNISATKNFTFFPPNRERDLPTVLATIILNDPETGIPLSIMGGTWITAMRTAASTAVAAKYLAKKDSKVVGIFGAGTQGASHLEAFMQIFDIKSVRVNDISKDLRDKFAKKMSKELGLEIIPLDDREKVVKGADIVATVTTANEALIKKEWVEPGMFVGKTGSYQEVDFGMLTSVDKLVVDWWEYVHHRVPEFTKTGIKRDAVYAEVAEVVAGKKKGRENDKEKILFISIGMGVEDAPVALRVYQKALKMGIGHKMQP